MNLFFHHPEKLTLKENFLLHCSNRPNRQKLLLLSLFKSEDYLAFHCSGQPAKKENSVLTIPISKSGEFSRSESLSLSTCLDWIWFSQPANQEHFSFYWSIQTFRQIWPCLSLFRSGGLSLSLSRGQPSNLENSTFHGSNQQIRWTSTFKVQNCQAVNKGWLSR